MNNDPTAPATKADIQLLMGEIGKLYQATEQWKEDLRADNGRWKEEMLRAMDERIAASEARTKQHFDVVVENIRHDLLGMHRDRIEQHEDRIRRLERHTGLAAA